MNKNELIEKYKKIVYKNLPKNPVEAKLIAEILEDVSRQSFKAGQQNPLEKGSTKDILIIDEAPIDRSKLQKKLNEENKIKMEEFHKKIKERLMSNEDVLITITGQDNKTTIKDLIEQAKSQRTKELMKIINEPCPKRIKRFRQKHVWTSTGSADIHCNLCNTYLKKRFFK